MTTTLNDSRTKAITGVVATIVTTEGLIEIYEFKHSGKVLSRAKISSPTGVLHPGIVIGIDIHSRWWVAHNHEDKEKPTFDLLTDYLDGEKGTFDSRPVKYSAQQIVERAISEVLKGKEYTTLKYNCQIFVNIIVRDDDSSESVDNLTNGAIAFGLFVTLIGALTENKTLRNTGLGIAGTAGAVKIYSKLK